MIREEDFNDNDPGSREWLGEVVDVEDPEGEGRIKVRVFGMYDELDDEHLPWCYPANHMTAGSDTGGAFYSVPKVGSVVEVKFDNDDPYHPFYTRNLHLSEDVKEFINGDTEAHVLWYDSDREMRVLYTKERGIVINLRDSVFTITEDDEIIVSNNGEQCVIKLGNDGQTTVRADNVNVVANDECEITTPELNLTGAETNIGAAPEFSAVLSEPLWSFLKMLATATDQKWPNSGGALSSAAQAAEQAATSNTVKVSK